LIDKYRAVAPSLEHARYWASVEWFDETIGELLDHLDRQGLAKETIVVYVTDNGWVQSEKGDAISLRSKRTPYEAGVRTPILVRWPGRIKPERLESYASTLDLVPTLLAATGGKIPAGLSGIDLRDRRSVMARRRIFGENFSHDAVDIRRPSTSLLSRWIIDDGWKLILPVPGINAEDVPDRPLLYQIDRDPDEQHDLAAREPGRVAQLRRRLDAWWSGR
jgi:uncharacterized sulfatase